MPGLADLNALSPEKRELLLDVGQFTLDMVGVVDPTPISDLTSGVVSLMRGNLTGAAISAIAIVPYVGDLAKLGKVPRYVDIVNKAIRVARTDNAFAAVLRPVLAKLLAVIDQIPMSNVPPAIRAMLDRLRRSIDDFLPTGAKVVSQLDSLTDDVLRRVFGSTANVGILPRQNVRLIVEFFHRYGVDGRNPARWAELIKGIDLHAIDAVSVTRIKPGELVAEYVDTARPVGRQIGQWMVKARGSVSHDNLGLSGAGRARRVFRVTEEVEVLKSKSGAAADHWTTGGTKPHKAITLDEAGRTVMKPAEQVRGGGDQYFLPEAWRFLEPVR
jgi:hypothetical protein